MDVIKFPEKPPAGVSELYNKLYDDIVDYTTEHEITTATLIGIVEMLKADILNDILNGE